MYSADPDDSVPQSLAGRSNEVEMNDRERGAGAVRPSVDGSEVEHENLKPYNTQASIAEEGGVGTGAGAEEQDPNAPKPIDRPRPRAEEEYGFAHPAASRPQRTIWIPKDQLGLAEEEERANLEMGIDASIENAEMNEKGKVDLAGEGQPPDLVLE